MLMFLLACQPDLDDRLEELEEDNAALQARLAELEENEREMMQQLARWEQTLSVLESAASGAPLTPASLNTAPEAATGSTAAATGCTHADGRYTIARSVLDDTASLSTSARVIPHKSASGDIDGYRISGIRRGSIAETCGLKNGDVVHSVSGHSLTSIEDAMIAYGALASASEVRVEVTRRGSPATVVIALE